VPNWNLKQKEEMMGKSSGGLPSGRPAIFGGLLHLLYLGHHRQIAKLLQHCNYHSYKKYNAREDLEQIKDNQRSVWNRMKEIGACRYIVHN